MPTRWSATPPGLRQASSSLVSGKHRLERPVCIEIDPRRACGWRARVARYRHALTRCCILRRRRTGGPAPGAYPFFTMSSNPPHWRSGSGTLRRWTSHRPWRPLRRPRQRGPSGLRSSGLRSGGARRDRTDDLLLAKQALSQLSYGPDSTL